MKKIILSAAVAMTALSGCKVNHVYLSTLSSYSNYDNETEDTNIVEITVPSRYYYSHTVRNNKVYLYSFEPREVYHYIEKHNLDPNIYVINDRPATEYKQIIIRNNTNGTFDNIRTVKNYNTGRKVYSHQTEAPKNTTNRRVVEREVSVDNIMKSFGYKNSDRSRVLPTNNISSFNDNVQRTINSRKANNSRDYHVKRTNGIFEEIKKIKAREEARKTRNSYNNRRSYSSYSYNPAPSAPPAPAVTPQQQHARKYRPVMNELKNSFKSQNGGSGDYRSALAKIKAKKKKKKYQKEHARKYRPVMNELRSAFGNQ